MPSKQLSGMGLLFTLMLAGCSSEDALPSVPPPPPPGTKFDVPSGSPGVLEKPKERSNSPSPNTPKAV